MVLIGIDFGDNDCCVAALQKPLTNVLNGDNLTIDVVTNTVEGRVMSSFVSFGERCRTFSLNAQNSHSLKIQNTIFGFKKLIGRKYGDPFVKCEETHLPYGILEDADGYVKVKVNHLGIEECFTVTQIAAMLLAHLKDHVVKTQKDKNIECVLAVPSYFKNDGRLALLDAASIANLNVIKLMNDHAAVALFYGFYKCRDIEKRNPVTVVFVDMGHSSLQVSICSISNEHAKVLNTAFSLAVGGREFNEKIAEYFTDDEMCALLSKDTSAMLRLLKECEKLKVKLSTCDLELPFVVGNLVDNKSVSGKLGRSKFEEICKPLLNEVRKTMAEAFDKSCCSKVHRVELIGGSTIMPVIKQIAKDVFKCEPSATLPRESVVAEGCALQCVYLSQFLSARKFLLTDIQPYPIKARYEEMDGTQIAFQVCDANRHAPFKTSCDQSTQHFDLFYGYAGITSGYTNKIGSIEKKKKDIVQFHINNNGILKTYIQSNYQKNKEYDVTTDNLIKFNAAMGELVKLYEDKLRGDRTKNALLIDKMAEIRSLSNETLKCDILKRNIVDLVKREVELHAADAAEIKRLTQKNAFEKNIYTFEDYLLQELSSFVTEEEHDEFMRKLADERDWLDDAQYSTEEYEDRFLPFEIPLADLKVRKEETDKVFEEINSLQRQIFDFCKGLEKCNVDSSWHEQDVPLVMNKHRRKVTDYRQIYKNVLEYADAYLTEGKSLKFYIFKEEFDDMKKSLSLAKADLTGLVFTSTNLIAITFCRDMLKTVLFRLNAHKKALAWLEHLEQSSVGVFCTEILTLCENKRKTEPNWESVFVDGVQCVYHLFSNEKLFISAKERKELFKLYRDDKGQISCLPAFTHMMDKFDEFTNQINGYISRGDEFVEKVLNLRKQIRLQFFGIEQDIETIEVSAGETRIPWKDSFADLLSTFNDCCLKYSAFFISEEERKDLWNYLQDMKGHIYDAKVRDIDKIDNSILFMEEKLSSLLERRLAYEEVIGEFDKFPAELNHSAMDSESENEPNKNWLLSFRRYLQIYQAKLYHQYSEVLSTKVKTELLQKCSEAEKLLDGIEIGDFKEFLGQMVYLYKRWDELSKRKSVYEELLHETAILKATLRKEYHIKSLQDLHIQKARNSEVFLTSLKTSGENVNLKWCKVNTEKGIQLSSLIGKRDEMDLIKQLDHPNILQLYDAFVENNGCYVVSELYHYTLGSNEAQIGRYTLKDAGSIRGYMTQICEALLYLKSEGIILDILDLQNIVITKNGVLKIDVLSSSPQFINSNSIKADHASEMHSTNEVNTYALGHLLHYMFVGYYLSASSPFTLNQLKRYSHSAAELIDKILVQESCSQFTFEDVLRHPFFQGKFEDKLDVKDDSSLLLEALMKYKLLLESALDHKLGPFISDKSRDDLITCLDNLSNCATVAGNDVETDFEKKIEEVFISCRQMLRLFTVHEDLQEELRVFENAILTSRAVIFELKDTKWAEYCVASACVDQYEQEVAKWKNQIAEAAKFEELPVSCEIVKDACIEFIDKMKNTKKYVCPIAEVTSL